MTTRLLSGLVFLGIGMGLLAGDAPPPTPRPLKILFVGDNAGHKPALRHRILAPVLAKANIDLVYTESLESLNPKTLAQYDGLLIYANHTKISPEQEQALLDFVEKDGKPLICLHCGSYCFLNSPKYIELVGGQFKTHKTGTFRTDVVKPDHPIMKGFTPFESFDETYVHTKHNEKDRIVLETRKEGKTDEPYTWVRTQGKGKVFYTAWGHDERTWNNPGFQNLVARGIFWACGLTPADVVPKDAAPKEDARPKMTKLAKDGKPFEYAKAKVAYYPPEKGGKREPLNKMQLPLEPAESMKHMVHPDDFELKEFITEEKLGGKPICMNWDERGRLWVAVTVDYPNNMQPAGQGHDKILCCEDTTGTGVADKVTVFADKLSIPTSLIFHDGGLIVHQAPDTLFLKDTKGTGVADRREILFSGWGTRDTHAGPSNLHYGLDNWIYGMVGYSGFSGTIWGESFKFSQGFYRFKPSEKKFEFLRGTNNNSWGIGLSEEGVLFGSTANGNPSVYMPVANRYYERVKGWSSNVLGGIAGSAPIYPITDHVRQVDWHGQHTAAAGHALYTARNYPQYYWNRTSFVAEPTGHVISTFEISGQGADYTSKNSWNLLASDDEWTAPIMAEVGPDGNVWFIDWYAFIVQHNPTPVGWSNGKGGAYETELRDKTHGRIYRLVMKGDKEQKAFSLKDAPPAVLVATLRNPNKFWRDHAQRLLVERGQKDVVPSLLAMIEKPKPDAIGIDAGPMHALWTLEGLKVLQVPEVAKAIMAARTSPAAGVRRAVAQLLPGTNLAPDSTVAEHRLLEDGDAQVRLAAMLALAEMPLCADTGPMIVRFLQLPANGDRWMKDAAIAAAAANGPTFVAALFEEASAKPLNFPAADILAIVVEHLARSGKAKEIIDGLAELDGAFAKPNPALAELLNTYLAGAIKGWTKADTITLDPKQLNALKALYPQVGFQTKGQLLQIAQLCESAIFNKEIAAIAEAGLKACADEAMPDKPRAEAVAQLIQLRKSDRATMEKLLEMVSPRTAPAVSSAIVESLLESGAGLTDAILKRYPGWSPALKSVALRAMLAKKDLTPALLAALEKKQVLVGDLSLAQKQGLSTYPDRRIADRAKKILAAGGSMPSADRQKVIDELMFTTEKTGDAKAGKLMFAKHCAVCHRINGEGNVVGPDLTGMSVHPKKELIVHIMDPSRDVEGNYRMYTVRTSAGLVLNGLLASETKTSVEILDAQAKKQTILREDIEQIVASTKSLMPEGFEKQMTPAEFTDLLEFLTLKGKYVPLPLDRVATTNSTKGMFFADDGKAERLTFKDWKPKVFEGVPFVLVDPTEGKNNVVLLNSPASEKVMAMPKSVSLACNTPAKAVHILGGIGGWAFPYGTKGSESMIVRLHYKGGKPEDHILRNGEEIADYIRVIDVAKSRLAFQVPTQQVRYLAVIPERNEVIESIELLKGKDSTAPIVVAVTVETP